MVVWLLDVPAGLIMYGFSTNGYVLQIQHQSQHIPIKAPPGNRSSQPWLLGAFLGVWGVFLTPCGFFVFNRDVINLA